MPFVLEGKDREGSFREIAKTCGMSKSSAHCTWKRNMSLREGHNGRKEDGVTKRKPGPRSRLSARDRRVLLRTLENMREHESFQQFKERVFRCCDDVDIATIARTIESLPRRIQSVIKGHGSQTKYLGHVHTDTFS